MLAKLFAGLTVALVVMIAGWGQVVATANRANAGPTGNDKPGCCKVLEQCCRTMQPCCRK